MSEYLHKQVGKRKLKAQKAVAHAPQLFGIMRNPILNFSVIRVLKTSKLGLIAIVSIYFDYFDRFVKQSG